MAAVRGDQLRVRQGARRREPADRRVRDRAQRPEPAAGITGARPGTRPVSSSKGVRTMPSAWSNKRERQYEHIKESEKKQGRSTKRAKEIAARTVNKERARSGETKGRASRTSTRDISSGRRGGLRSGTRREKGRTKEQLYNEAKRRNISGRSRMTKAQLQRAVDAKK